MIPGTVLRTAVNRIFRGPNRILSQSFSYPPNRHFSKVVINDGPSKLGSTKKTIM